MHNEELEQAQSEKDLFFTLILSSLLQPRPSFCLLVLSFHPSLLATGFNWYGSALSHLKLLRCKVKMYSNIHGSKYESNTLISVQ